MADMDNAIALGIKPMQIDVATPLLQAAKIRQSQMETQNQQIQMQRDAIGAEARGLAPLVGSPDYEPARQASTQRLSQMGILSNPQAVAGWERDSSSPLGLNSLIARSQSPANALQEKQLAETGRHNQASEGQAAATLAETRRQHDIAEGKPVSVSAGASLVNPKTGQAVYQGSNGLSEAGNEIAARQIINGDLSALQNVGRGAQGDAKLTSIKNKAAEILMQENGMTAAEAAAHLGQKLQAFKASTVGQSAEERTRGVREANLNLILKATEAAIPAALEASDEVTRYAGSFVPLNKIIQNGQVMTSDANLRKFGMANLQLAEHWARAMNPTGVMRESDRDMALKFLSTADSNATYKQVVNQLKTQITRERDAVRGGAPGATPTPGGGSTNLTGPDKTITGIEVTNLPTLPPGFHLVK
jgi:hypothetical protein